MDHQWISVEKELPPEGVKVDCIRTDGYQQELVRNGGLMFLPDMSMYIYVGLKMWRHQ